MEVAFRKVTMNEDTYIVIRGIEKENENSHKIRRQMLIGRGEKPLTSLVQRHVRNLENRSAGNRNEIRGDSRMIAYHKYQKSVVE